MAEKKWRWPYADFNTNNALATVAAIITLSVFFITPSIVFLCFAGAVTGYSLQTFYLKLFMKLGRR